MNLKVDFGIPTLLNLPGWLQQVVTSNASIIGVENEAKIRNLSFPPSTMAKSYKNMVAFGNHFRVTIWPSVNNVVTYGYGVLGVFEHT
jgi:hypothetical protein